MILFFKISAKIFITLQFEFSFIRGVDVKTNILRNTVGVRNPYAVAELKLKRKIDWKKKSHQSRIKLLEKAFNKPYHELFDPRYNSPLFPKKTDKRLGRVRSGAGDAISCDPNPCPVIDDWKSITDGKVTPDAESYDDLIQGCLPNCYFVSALSALAWATMTQKDFRSRINNNPYSYTFYSPKVDGDGNIILNTPPAKDPPVIIDDRIPVQKPEVKIYSRSYSPNETWPCLYEKAYATWVYCKMKNLKTDDTSILPDYLTICHGNPLTALMQVWGQTPTYFFTNGMIGSDIYTIIGTQNPNPPIRPVIRPMTNYPAVAWTHNPLDNKDPIPPGVVYRNDVLVANHSYTILGVYPWNGRKYIVLRNPWGQKCGDPVQTCNPDTDPLKCAGILPQNSFAGGSWLGKNLADKDDGIFALDADLFQQYFAGFGWISGY